MKTQKRQWKPNPGSIIKFREGHLADTNDTWWTVLDNSPCTKATNGSTFCKNCRKILGKAIVIKETTNGKFFSTKEEYLLSISLRCVGCWMLYRKVTHAEKKQNGAT